jgi:lysophospholipase L1-like esterase
MFRPFSALIILLTICSNVRAAPPPFELKDNDRVIFIGNAFIERDQHYGFFETLLTLRYADRNVIFRNFGWSGDTVFVTVRSGSGPQKGIDALVSVVAEQKPTVIIVGYGMNESFEGPAGLDRFVAGYNALLAALASTNARLVLLAPIYHENLGPPLPDPADHNKSLAQYTDAIAQIAAQHNAYFVNLFKDLRDGKQPLTDDGIHLTPNGYLRAALASERSLGLPETALEKQLAEKGLSALAQPQFSQFEKLRATIRAKNTLFFDRYRPSNDMYIFFGRKHEQGQNAKEIPQFDKFIAEKESEIAQLKK